MSRNRTHLAVGGFMLLLGLVLAVTTRDVVTPVVALDKIGIVLVVLGAVELAWTVTVMRRPAPVSRDR